MTMTQARRSLIKRLTELNDILYESSEPSQVDTEQTDLALAYWVEDLIELATANRLTIREIQASLTKGGN